MLERCSDFDSTKIVVYIGNINHMPSSESVLFLLECGLRADVAADARRCLSSRCHGDSTKCTKVRSLALTSCSCILWIYM